MTIRPTWWAWLAEVPARLLGEWRLKATLLIVLAVTFNALYFSIGHLPVFPVHMLPETGIDRLIGFQPYGWIWVYQTIYGPLYLIPGLMNQKDQLARFARGLVWLSIISFAFFFFWPTSVIRPPMDDAVGLYALVRKIDSPRNALPSLHAGLLVYALCASRRAFGGRAPIGFHVGWAAWVALILFSTLITKQHYVIDVAAGGVLGWLNCVWAWRGYSRVSELSPAAPSPRPVES